MSDYCYSFPIFNRVQTQAATMDRMVEKVGVDPLVAVRVENGMAWYEARTRCLECRSAERCTAWLDCTTHDGDADVPDFCPNNRFFQKCKPTEV